MADVTVRTRGGRDDGLAAARPGSGGPAHPARWWGGDAVLAGAVMAVGIVGTVAADGATGIDRPIDAPGLALVAAGAAALAVRRRWPLATALAVTAVTAGYLLAGYPYGPMLAAFAVAVYTVAAHRPLPVATAAALVALAALVAQLFTHPAALPGPISLAPAMAWVAVPLAVGVSVRVTREARRREQAEAVRRRVDEERLRIAREVHDVVGHGLAAIRMQADITLHVLARKPEQAEQALAAISRTAAGALDEVRAALAVVRGPEGEPRTGPGLHRLDELRQRTEQAGLPVQIAITGDRRELPGAVELAGYRVVQESLTNALRHGGGGTARIGIDYGREDVLITVVNPLARPAPRPGAPGSGIPGMTERVAVLGGEVTAGQNGTGQFEVRARIPVRATR